MGKPINCHTCFATGSAVEIGGGCVVGAHRAPCGAVCSTGSFHATSGALLDASIAGDVHSAFNSRCPRGCFKPAAAPAPEVDRG